MRESKSADRLTLIFFFCWLFLLLLLFLHLLLLFCFYCTTSSIRRLKTTYSSINTTYYTRTPPRIHISIRCCQSPEDHSKTTACLPLSLLLSCNTLSTFRVSGTLSTILSTPNVPRIHGTPSTHTLAPTGLSGQIRCPPSISRALSSTTPCSQNGGEEVPIRGAMRMSVLVVLVAPGATQCLRLTHKTLVWSIRILLTSWTARVWVFTTTKGPTMLCTQNGIVPANPVPSRH